MSAATPSPPVDRGAGIHVLLVEDNAGDVELIRAMLESPWSLDDVPSLGEATQALESGRYDAIITDLGLPDADALVAIRHLLLTAPHTPVVVLTGRRDRDFGPEAVAAGAQDFIRKDDLNEQVLTRTLRYAIERNAWLGQLRAVVANNSDAILVVDRDGLVRFANPVAEAMLGGSSSTTVGGPFGYAVEPGTTQEVALASDEQGGRRFAELRASDIVWAGEPATVVSMRDISDRRRAENLTHQLAHADRLAAVGRLAAGVAHEVSNPASFVLGNFELLGDIIEDLGPREVPLDDEARRARVQEGQGMLRDCQSGVRRVVRLVKDLRAFSRRDEEHTETLDLVEVVATACRMTSNEIRHRARLIRELDPVPRIWGDRSKLEQVFTNLLLNAAQSVEAGNVADNYVKVSTGVREGKVVVVVEDSGCGIPRSEQVRIFEPFFTTKSRDRGTGLGLALSADIVRLHGGELAFESDEGAGSRFEVSLPVQRVEAETPAESTRSRESRPRRKVLFIDDEPQLLSIYERTIGRFHDVHTSASASEALALALDGSFDAILCDIMMPELDGVEFHGRIHARNPGLADKIIFCTGGVFTSRAQAWLAKIDNPVLDKPFTIETALELIERVAV